MLVIRRIALVLFAGCTSSSPMKPPPPPVAVATPASITVAAGQKVWLYGDKSTIGMTIPCSIWSVTAKPTNSSAATMFGQGRTCDQISPSLEDFFTADLPGTYTLQLVLTDSFKQTSQTTEMVTALPCAPLFGDQTATGDIDIQVTVPVSESCQPGATFQYAWNGLWVAQGTVPKITPGTGTATTAQVGVDGSATFGQLLLQLTATDNMGRATSTVIALSQTAGHK